MPIICAGESVGASQKEADASGENTQDHKLQIITVENPHVPNERADFNTPPNFVNRPIYSLFDDFYGYRQFNLDQICVLSNSN